MATLELTIDEGVAAEPAKRGRRLGLLFWMAIGWMIFMIAVAIFAHVLPLPSPTDMDMLERRAPFSAEHWLGTDGLGRDELSRLIYGARISLVVGLCAPVIGLTIGGALGMLAGYFRGRFESVVVGSMDVLLAFPPLILAMAVTAYLGQSILNLTFILGVARRSRLHAGGAGGDADAGAARIRHRGAGAGGDACAHPAARIAAQCRRCRCWPSSCSGCRHHRGRGRAVLPRPRRAAADIELGQHDRGGA